MPLTMPTIPFDNIAPIIDSTSFIAPDAWIIGRVSIGARCSIFFNTVIRGDIQPITIGSGVNLQEHVLVHTSHGMSPVTVEDDVTIGHRAIIHGCVVRRCSLIGMGATILDNATIGSCCIIGAHTLVPKGMIIPDRSLVMGTPAKIIRSVTDSEVTDLENSAKNYRELGTSYKALLKSLP